jgi:hypothetical protein
MDLSLILNGVFETPGKCNEKVRTNIFYSKLELNAQHNKLPMLVNQVDDNFSPSKKLTTTQKTMTKLESNFRKVS